MLCFNIWKQFYRNVWRLDKEHFKLIKTKIFENVGPELVRVLLNCTVRTLNWWRYCFALFDEISTSSLYLTKLYVTKSFEIVCHQSHTAKSAKTFLKVILPPNSTRKQREYMVIGHESSRIPHDNPAYCGSIHSRISFILYFSSDIRRWQKS